MPFREQRTGRRRESAFAIPRSRPTACSPTGDGKAIILGIQNEREWQMLSAQVLGDAALASDPRFCDNVQRVANRAALEAIIADRFARRTRDERCGFAGAADIAFGHLNRSRRPRARHPQLRRVAANNRRPTSTFRLRRCRPAMRGWRRGAHLSTSTVPRCAGNLSARTCVIAPQHGLCVAREWVNGGILGAKALKSIIISFFVFWVDLSVSLHHIVHRGIGCRPTTCRTSSRRFLPKLGPWPSGAALRGSSFSRVERSGRAGASRRRARAAWSRRRSNART